MEPNRELVSAEEEPSSALSAERRAVKPVKLHLKNGVVLRITNDFGMSPVLVAARYSNEADKFVPLLIENGYDVTVKDSHGYNALHCLAIAFVEHADLAKVLIEKGVSLDDRTTEFQFQPIHLAAENEKIELLKVYLDHGANVNAQTAKGESPMHFAASCKNPAVLLTLLKRGANIDLKLSDGKTVLHAACSFHKEDDNRKNIRILLSVGADMCVVDHAGKTAFDTASRWAGYTYRIVNQSAWLMIRALALKKACLTQSASIEFKGDRIVEQWPAELLSWTDYYQKCVNHSYRMKSMRLIDTWTLFDLLTKCPCQTAALMHDRELEKKLTMLIDLKIFSVTYADNIREAFESAKFHHEATLKQEDVINDAIHNTLPWMVVRKVARYTVDCEQCELKRIVQASRKVCSE